MKNSQTIWQDLRAVREQAPLVHNITNYVVMNVTANALLALGGSPLMAHEPAELEDLLALASALVLNIGTLDAAWIASMHAAATFAARRKLPVILDPVGAGASRLRTQTALDLIRLHRPAIVRGNASEIMALAGASGAGATKGVDSAHATDAAEASARSLALSSGSVVVASGAVDFITDGKAAVHLSGGSPLIPRITGMGCTSTALLGAFAAVAATPLQAAIDGMAVMKAAAEIAAEKARGLGSLQVHFLDALGNLAESDLSSRGELA